ncbi:ABC transporter permease [Pseudodesulfovibrio sp. JC047]|uniref:ABC transporter permease n=1 Tax=Pseudodesulfovibrio sp. JC047 TaxID=2683199 RepID=UPI0031B9D1C8
MKKQSQTLHISDATVSVSDHKGTRIITLGGRLDAAGIAAIWDQTLSMLSPVSSSDLTADLRDVTYLDGAGVALLLKLKQMATEHHAKFSLAHLRDEDRHLIDLAWNSTPTAQPLDEQDRPGLVESINAHIKDVWLGIHEMIAFVGESAVLLTQAMIHPRQVRWKNVLHSCINVGVDSLFIITLIGFLMGLIMSFQSAVSLERFGGEIFVPNMLGLVMFREMGPLVTAILLAARSGSAFAAEIGTMKINEELDALTTMGLSPMRFLVVPKIIATMIVVPLMILFFNLASLVGGAVVMLSMGYPLVTFTSRVFSYLDYSDFWSGMGKGIIFSFLVAGVGCLRGIQTRSGASAVGLSTTSAVVSGIILIAFADGIFAMAFYYIGI